MSLKRDKPKVFRVDVEKKGVSMIFRVKNEPPERMKIRNKTNHTFKINQVNYEQYGEFLGPDGDEIGFFWDDPFSTNKLTFKRLFNNQVSSQGFSIDLTKMVKKTVKIINLNNWKGDENSPKKKKYSKVKHNSEGPSLKHENMVQVTIEKAYTGDGLLITIDNMKSNQAKVSTLFKMFPRKEELPGSKSMEIQN